MSRANHVCVFVVRCNNAVHLRVDVEKGRCEVEVVLGQCFCHVRRREQTPIVDIGKNVLEYIF